jgi:hypothetical protein
MHYENFNCITHKWAVVRKVLLQLTGSDFTVAVQISSHHDTDFSACPTNGLHLQYHDIIGRHRATGGPASEQR